MRTSKYRIMYAIWKDGLMLKKLGVKADVGQIADVHQMPPVWRIGDIVQPDGDPRKMTTRYKKVKL